MLKYHSPLHKAAYFLLLFVFLLLFIFGCVNPYKYLPNRPPETAKDSSALLARCIKALPLDTTYSHIFIPVRIENDSSAYYKAISDSLSKSTKLVRDSIEKVYVDTCRSAIGLYEVGFNKGYDEGNIDGKKDTKANDAALYQKQLRLSDSLWVIENTRLKQSYNIRLVAADNSVGIANKNAEKYRGKYETWLKAFVIAACAAALFLIICILLWKFRRQARSANNIINDVKNLK